LMCLQKNLIMMYEAFSKTKEEQLLIQYLQNKELKLEWM